MLVVLEQTDRNKISPIACGRPWVTCQLEGPVEGLDPWNVVVLIVQLDLFNFSHPAEFRNKSQFQNLKLNIML